MSELHEIKTMLTDHMEKSNKNHLEVKTALTEIKTHAQYTKEKLDSHDKDIEDWKMHKNKVYGVVISLSLFFGWIAAWLKTKLGL